MNSVSRITFIASLTAVLAGCAVGPDYRQPEPSAPTSWSTGQGGGATNLPVQVAQWWKTFNDPQLDALIARAVESNHDLRIAEGRLREARALRSGAVWDFGPSVTGGAGYARRRWSENAQTFPGPQLLTSSLYDAHFDATWEIDVFGGKRRALESATAQVAAMAEDRRDVLVIILAEVARNYVEVRGLQERIAITHKNLEAQNQAVQITRSRFETGLTSELDVKQAEALAASTRSQLPSLDTGLKQGIHRLGVLLGQQPSALQEEFTTAKPIPTLPPEVPVGLPSELLRRRPDVRRAERQLASSTANIGVETAELFPKFALMGTAGLQSIDASTWLSAGSRYFSAGPSVTWRLLDFGRIRSQVKAANARQEQALAAYERTVLISFEDVENALVAYANEQQRYRSLNDSVAANNRARELARQLYSDGLGDFLAVLDAERSFYSAEDQLVESRRVMTQNLVALYKALGGGWEESK